MLAGHRSALFYERRHCCFGDTAGERHQTNGQGRSRTAVVANHPSAAGRTKLMGRITKLLTESLHTIAAFSPVGSTCYRLTSWVILMPDTWDEQLFGSQNWPFKLLEVFQLSCRTLSDIDEPGPCYIRPHLHDLDASDAGRTPVSRSCN